MVKKTVIKNKFSQLNNKRFYFPDNIASLPFGHKNLKEIDGFKKENGRKIEKYFWEEKEVLFNMGKNALKNTLRIYLYRQSFMSSRNIFNINQKMILNSKKKALLKKNTKDIILSGEWMK